MRFVVMVKQVPDTSQVKVDETGSLIRSGVPSVLDPYSERALMHILSIREPEDIVTVATMGPPQAEAALRRCIGLGADDAFLITDKSLAGADTWATARALAAFLSKIIGEYDICAFGRQTIDGGTGQVPSEVATILGVQQFCYATWIRRDMTVEQDYGSFSRVCSAPKGSVVSFSDVDPSGAIQTAEGYLRGINAEIKKVDRVALGLGLYSVGLKGSTTKIVSTSAVSDTRKGMMVEISHPDTAADMILKEARSIQ